MLIDYDIILDGAKFAPIFNAILPRKDDIILYAGDYYKVWYTIHDASIQNAPIFQVHCSKLPESCYSTIRAGTLALERF